MKWSIIKRGIIAFTFVSVFLAVGTISMLKNTEQETAQFQTSIVVYSPPPVNNFVENVEKHSQVVDNPVDDVPNSDDTPAYTEEQLEIIAIIIYQEAGADYCSDDTRNKVGSVFLNRVNSPLFPNTFEAVATGYKQYGTLYWTGIKWPDRASLPQESHAVERAYTIAEDLLIGGSVLPENVIWQAEFEQGEGVYCYQDGIYFCY